MRTRSPFPASRSGSGDALPILRKPFGEWGRAAHSLRAVWRMGTRSPFSGLALANAVLLGKMPARSDWGRVFHVARQIIFQGSSNEPRGVPRHSMVLPGIQRNLSSRPARTPRITVEHATQTRTVAVKSRRTPCETGALPRPGIEPGTFRSSV